MQYGGESACVGCRERYARRDRLPPCEGPEQRCPFTPSPGFEGRVASDNRLAWYLWERSEILGLNTVLEFMDLTLTPLEAEHLLKKIALLAGLAAEHRRSRQNAEQAKNK